MEFEERAQSVRTRVSGWALVICLFLAFPFCARADEYDQFISAKNAFDAGEYREAISRFNELLTTGLSSAALVLECHKLIAVSYLFDGNRVAAEDHFNRLLTIDPNYVLDPMIFPIDVIDLFTEIKNKNEERLKALAFARAKEAERQKAREEERRKAELEKLTRNIYFEKNRRTNSLLVAITPFGAGQFQNGERIKGAFFLGGELLLSAAAITTYFLHESLRDRAEEPFYSTSERQKAERLEATYRITNQTSLLALTALALTGIVDALYNYQAETVSWKRVRETDVPKSIKPQSGEPTFSLAPALSVESIGLVLAGEF